MESPKNSKARAWYLSALIIQLVLSSPTYAKTMGSWERHDLPINEKLTSPSQLPTAKDNLTHLSLRATLTPSKLLPSSAAVIWSLPMNGKVGSYFRTITKSLTNSPKAPPKELKGGICQSDQTNIFSQRIDELLDSALGQDGKTKVLDKAVAHYRTTTQRVLAQGKDAFDYLVPFRGFGPSSEAGDIILDEKIKLKSRASAEYAHQKHIDETHIKIVTNVLQLAMGLGYADKIRGTEMIASGFQSLKDLVGQSEAEKTLQMLSTWVHGLSIPESVYTQPIWDVSQRQDKVKYILETSLDNDQVVHEITKRLHKYNKRSKFARVSAHVVQTTLGVAALTPSFIGPAAKLALLTFVMATGGPEQCKLLKELYLDKRFESRWKVINEEAHLAMENYQLALLTHNPVLLACSESLLDEMTGPEHVEKVFGRRVLLAPVDKASLQTQVGCASTSGL